MRKMTRREAEKLFQTLANRSQISIYIAQDGKFCYVNPCFQKDTGYTEEELLGRDALSLVHPEDRDIVRENAINMLKEELDNPYQFRTVSKDGSIRWATEVISSIQYKGKPASLGNYIDITERIQMQERLLIAERLATLGQFSGNISHELRNPLGVIGSSAYYLETKLKDADDKVHEHLNRIESSVAKSTAIIESLLNLTRMKEPRLEVTDLIAITNDAVVTSKLPNKIDTIYNFPEQEAPVKADREQLRMALKNIIKNAGEAMDGRGTLTVAIRTNADGHAEISITDTGPGIPVENLERIFQPLFTTKAQGFGFGLSITKTIIEKHGGTVEARSEPGKGATIITRLPLYADKSKEA